MCGREPRPKPQHVVSRHCVEPPLDVGVVFRLDGYQLDARQDQNGSRVGGGGPRSKLGVQGTVVGDHFVHGVGVIDFDLPPGSRRSSPAIVGASPNPRGLRERLGAFL